VNRFLSKPVSPAILVFALSTIILSAALVLAPAPLKAQTIISGDIAGTVMDPSGAAVPGADITVSNTGTGGVNVAKSGGAGDYRVSLLPPGAYQVSVSAGGFQTTQLNVTVRVGQITNGNLKLSLAQASQSVQVEGSEVPLLETENSDLSTTFTMEQVQNLPNPGGDITYPIQTTQGVVMNSQGGYGNSSAFGLPASSNNFTVNGAADNDPFLNLNGSGPSNLLLGLNDVGEVSVVANAYSAQYGTLGGIQENIVSRSGTNSFHGNAIYYWTNSDMNANDWFNDHSRAPQPFSNASQWGASLGGPIIKNKTFFFVNYEGLRFVTAPADFVLIPSAFYQSSVLANLAAKNPAEIPFYQRIFNLYNTAPGATRATPYAGTSYSDSFEANPKNFLPEDLVTARLDHKLGPNDNMFVHFRWDYGVQPTFVDPINSAFNARSSQPDYEGQLEETHTFGANVVNQFLFAASWYGDLFVSANPALAAATFPYAMTFGDGSFTALGGEDYEWPQGRNVTQFQFNDDVSWNRGKHTVKFGFTFKRNDVTDFDLGINTTPNGTELGPASNGPLGTLDSFGAGHLYEATQNFPLRPSEPIALYNLGFYVQDQWKFTPNFQFTAGIRVEHNSNAVCQTNCFGRFGNTYTSITAGLDTPYDNVILTGLRQAFNGLQSVTVDPRIGFTWSPPNHPNMVVRGGYGMFTDIFPATFADDLLNNPPLNPQFTVVGGLADPALPGSFATLLAGTNQSFKTGFASGGSYSSIYATNPNFTLPSVYNTDKNIHYPTYQEYSLQIQQQIGRSTSVQIGYVGNHGYHEPVVNNGVNTYGFGGAPATPALPAFATVTEIQSNASSNYNGLLVSVKNQSKHVTLGFNYTYSHALDEVSNGGFVPFGINSLGQYSPGNSIDPFNLALQNYGNADYDVRHSLNGSYLITVPHFGGPRLLTDNWQLGGTLFWHRGFPFSVTDGTVTDALEPNYGNTLSDWMLANVVNPTVSHHCGKAATVTPCFGGPASTYFANPTSFGGQRRNQFTGPGYFNTDLSVMKGFKVPGLESGKVQVGAQGFNVLNHPNFQNPDFDFSSPTFGSVVSTASPPTSVYGSFLGGDASPRIVQLKAVFQF
jgi:outer membrane receptor protein involved in Fe transport